MTKKKGIFEVDENIYSWEDVESRIERRTWAALYGNGMSMTFYSQGFSYKNLSDRVKSKDAEIARLLNDVVKDDNLEKLLLRLAESREVIDNLHDTRCPPASAVLNEKYSGVQEGFIKTVNELHPESIFSLSLTNYKSFILKFRWVFTTNYDLLTYWALVNDIPFRAGKGAYSEFTDFFWPKQGESQLKYHEDSGFLKNRPTHIYYLHGALHLFNAEYGQTVKVSPQYADSINATLLENIEQEMKSGNVPLFVAEGDSTRKELRIQSSPYLRFCYKELREEQFKSLIIFGQSLADNDAHLFNAVLQNPNLEDIWFGIYIPSFDSKDPEEVDELVKTEIEGLRNRATNAIMRHGGGRFPKEKRLHIYVANGLSEWLIAPTSIIANPFITQSV